MTTLGRLCSAVAHAALAKARLQGSLDEVAHRASRWPYMATPGLTLGYVASMGPGWRDCALDALRRQYH